LRTSISLCVSFCALLCNCRCNGGANLGDTYESMQRCIGNCTGQCSSQLWRYMSNSISNTYFMIFGEHFLGQSQPCTSRPFSCILLTVSDKAQSSVVLVCITCIRGGRTCAVCVLRGSKTAGLIAHGMIRARNLPAGYLLSVKKDKDHLRVG
jgi:hypothetical protein